MKTFLPQEWENVRSDEAKPSVNKAQDINTQTSSSNNNDEDTRLKVERVVNLIEQSKVDITIGNFGFLDFWISEVVPSTFPDPSFRFLLEPKFQKSKEPFSMLWIFEAEMSIPASFASWKKVAMVTPLPFAERHLSYCLSVSRWSYFPFCLLTQ